MSRFSANLMKLELTETPVLASKPALDEDAPIPPTDPGFTPNAIGLEIPALDRPGDVGADAAPRVVVAKRS